MYFTIIYVSKIIIMNLHKVTPIIHKSQKFISLQVKKKKTVAQSQYSSELNNETGNQVQKVNRNKILR